MTIQFEYKCRRCGGIDDGLHMGTDAHAFEGIHHLNRAMLHSPERSLELFGIHRCPDGGRGIMDLIGHTPPKES